MSASSANGNGKTVWSLLTGSAPLIALAFGGLWAVMTMQMSTELGPVRNEQAISRTERKESRESAEKLTNTVSELREELVAMKAAVTETETQFRALENYLNLMRADQLRVNALLWKQAFGETYPDAAFYPSIARPK